jgi:hypothetical protein
MFRMGSPQGDVRQYASQSQGGNTTIPRPHEPTHPLAHAHTYQKQQRPIKKMHQRGPPWIRETLYFKSLVSDSSLIPSSIGLVPLGNLVLAAQH